MAVSLVEDAILGRSFQTRCMAISLVEDAILGRSFQTRFLVVSDWLL